MEIKVGYLAAYDYELIKTSIPTLYEQADKIVIALDKDRLTFAGKRFDVQPSFFDYLRQIDTQRKIEVYEDSFYVEGMAPMKVETRTRNMLAKFMGEGGWHFQMDVDEYFVDFNRLVTDLRQRERSLKHKKLSIKLYWCTIFKIADGGYYLVDDSWETFPAVTNHPVYDSGRYNDSNEVMVLNHVVLHQSFGRTDQDLETKFRNWGHRDDFDSDAYLEFWKSVTVHNCKYLRDFNATHPWLWRKLKFVRAESVAELLQKIPSSYALPSEKVHPLKKWVPPVLFHRLVRNS